MKDQIVMATNGNLAIAVPLYRHSAEESLGSLDGFAIFLSNNFPLAYAIDCGELGVQLFNAEFVESNMEFIAEL